MSELNEELLDRTLAHIKAHPEEWDQEAWRCSTGMCFAGHAAILAGAQWSEPDDPTCDQVLTPDGTEMDVGIYAAKALGLGSINEMMITAMFRRGCDGLQHWLFASSNTLEHIERIITELKEAARVKEGAVSE